MPILKPEERLGSILAERYRLDAILGKGGMGVVFSGTHTWNNRRIAVKVLLPQYAEDEEILERFFREAEAVAALDHPNVVEVLDSGEDDEGDAYIVLELLDGEPLDALLAREGRLSVEETLSILVPVLDALAFAHGHGVIHRDLKPANIFVSKNARGVRVPKLLDFGVAKLAESTRSFATRTGSVLGTPQYMSPEQAGSGEAVGAASDVWSMGVVLYRCLTGALPVGGDSMAQMLVKVISGPPIVTRKAAPEVPEPIAAVVDRALRRSLDERHPSIDALLEEMLDAARRVGFEVARDGATRALSISERPPPRGVDATSATATKGAGEDEHVNVHVHEDEDEDEHGHEHGRAGVGGAEATYAPTVRLDDEADAPEPTYAPTVRLDDAPMTDAPPVRRGGPVDGSDDPPRSPGTASDARPPPAPSGRWRLAVVALAAAALAGLAGLGYASIQGPDAVERTVVSDPPGAAVFVDGERAGTAPVTLQVTEERSREVRLELDGHWPEHVYVAHSDPDTIEVELRPREAEPTTVTRRIVSDPPGAVVFVGGDRRGVTPLDLTVSTAQSLEVRLELEGRWPEHLYVSASDPEVVEVELRTR